MMYLKLEFRPVQIITGHVIYNSPYKYWPDENDPKQIIKYQYNCYFNGKDIFFRIENSGFVKSCDDHDVLRLIFSGIGWLRPIQCCCLHGLFWNGRLWCIWAFPLISDSHHRDEPMKPGINKKKFCKIHIFWEGQKFLRNLHLTFVCMYCRHPVVASSEYKNFKCMSQYRKFCWI